MALILALDTAANRCTCALSTGEAMLACLSAEMDKGHAEYLMGQIEALLSQAGVAVGDINRTGVNCGPGSFTGIRVGVATARGLALALDIPAIGISRFTVIEHLARRKSVAQYPASPLTVVLQGSGSLFYAQHFGAIGCPMNAPFQATAEAIAASLPMDSILSGTGAAIIAQAAQTLNIAPSSLIVTDSLDEVEALAALAAAITANNLTPPTPLYLRAPDAKPQTNFAVAIQH